MTELTLKATHDHLVKVASTKDPLKAISEFVWNALDADAEEVSVDFQTNALGGIEAIVIRDNGTGISRQRAQTSFENLGDSWKLKVRRTNRFSRAMHGKAGQGRLKFFSLAHKASWKSIYQEDKELIGLEIRISSDALHKAEVDPQPLTEEKSTGTVLTLTGLKDTFDWLLGHEARLQFSMVFAPYVMQYPNVKIFYSGHIIDPNVVVDESCELQTVAVVCPNRAVRDLSIRVIEWKSKSEGRRIHLGGEKGIVLGSQPANITAPGFDFSVYAYSQFFEELANSNLLDLEGLADPDFGAVLEYIRSTVGDYFRTRQAERSASLIQDLKNAGIYPYTDDPQTAIERKEREVFDIATHAVSSYSTAFKKADNPLKKITLSLLREAVAHNPESVTRILRAVFDLPKSRQDDFSSLLKRTELGHIISASSLIADRVVTLRVLHDMVFDPKRNLTVKERGELDAIVRDNTWIFGESFHFTVAEAGLTRIMQRVADDLGITLDKNKRLKKPDGKTGRLDVFMGRLVPHPDPKHREYLVLELKRPKLVISRKETDQIEDYANALVNLPEFKGTSTCWNFYLITGEYDKTVNGRITQKDRPVGVLIDQPNYKIWVKTWSELIRDAESRLQFVQDKLQVEVDADEIEERIQNLKKSIMPSPEDGAEMVEKNVADG
ncbi:MAG: ATP-binding protein [Brucella anthropi]